jgi:hypothetical protein
MTSVASFGASRASVISAGRHDLRRPPPIILPADASHSAGPTDEVTRFREAVRGRNETGKEIIIDFSRLISLPQEDYTHFRKVEKSAARGKVEHQITIPVCDAFDAARKMQDFRG